MPFIFVNVDWVQVKKIIQMADPLLIGLCLIVHLPVIWIKSERWRYILSLQGHHLKWLDSFLFYTSSVYLGLVTPGRLGEFAKVLYVKQNNVTTAGRAFLSVLIDRLFDIYLLFVVAMFGLFFLMPHPSGRFLGLLGIVLAVVAFWSFVVSAKTPQWILVINQKLFPSKVSAKLSGWAELFFEGAKCVRGTRLGRVVVLTILTYSFFFSQYLLVAKALSISIPFLTLIQIVATSSLISMIPITIAGLGTREAVFLYFFSQLGVDFDMAIAFSMGVFFVIYMGCSLFGALAFWLRPLDLRLIKQLKAEKI